MRTVEEVREFCVNELGRTGCDEYVEMACSPDVGIKKIIAFIDSAPEQKEDDMCEWKQTPGFYQYFTKCGAIKMWTDKSDICSCGRKIKRVEELL